MNIVDEIIAIIFEYQQIAKWSKTHKGESIKLSEDGSKAVCVGPSEAHSVRADFPIERGQITSWELECYQTNSSCYFYGVVSSKEREDNFGVCPAGDGIESAFGVDDYFNGIYLGGGYTNSKWDKPRFQVGKVFTLKMTADWKDRKQCKLTVFYQGKKLNDTNDEYTFLLPMLDDDFVWYPCITPYNKNAYCIIRYP